MKYISLEELAYIKARLSQQINNPSLGELLSNPNRELIKMLNSERIGDKISNIVITELAIYKRIERSKSINILNDSYETIIKWPIDSNYRLVKGIRWKH